MWSTIHAAHTLIHVLSWALSGASHLDAFVQYAWAELGGLDVAPRGATKVLSQPGGRPYVSIATNASEGMAAEDSGDAMVFVSLSEPANTVIKVRFTVSQTYDGGYIRIRTEPGSVDQAVDDGGNEIPGTYDLTFSSGMTTKTLVISEMDGTTDTLAGLDLNAMVTTEDENPAGVRWCDFYDKAEPVILRVYDVPPVILCPEGQEFEVTYSSMMTYAIHYGCTDVAADLEAGVRVKIEVDGMSCMMDTLTNTTVKTCLAKLYGLGSHNIEITFLDKDFVESRYQRMIDVLIRGIATNAAPNSVTNAIEAAGFADEAGVKAAIGGSAAEYAAFKAWAWSVKVSVGGDGEGAVATQAGEAAVVANTNAAAAYLLGAERLFANAPKVEFEEVVVGEEGTEGTKGTMTVAVSVKDGEVVVPCDAEKVAAMFESTSDLGDDWNGETMLTPIVQQLGTVDGAMRFKVTPGDGTSSKAFLRIRR